MRGTFDIRLLRRHKTDLRFEVRVRGARLLTWGITGRRLALVTTLFYKPAQNSQILDVLRKFFAFWRFQYHWYVPKPSVVNDVTKSIESNMSFTDMFVAVDLRAQLAFAVVDLSLIHI